VACIFCLAVIAAVGLSTGIALDEWLERKLSNLADSGSVVHETGSVATWRGKLHATLDDGSEASVRATIRIYKDSARVSVQVDDHTLTQSEAERLEDDVAAALDATIVERRYPPTGPDGLPVSDHPHETRREGDADVEDDCAEEVGDGRGEEETEIREDADAQQRTQKHRQ
jgi:hypothetical protein